MKKIAVITSGGDAPGMNAAVRAVVRQAIFRNIEVVGIKRGFIGLLEDDYKILDARAVSGIIDKGGTFLRTGRCPELKTTLGMNKAIKALESLQIDGLVVIGGDGSLTAAYEISRRGIPVVCIPASIDNDIFGTDETIGFDTAFNTAMQAIDKIRDTAASHDRIFIVEVMGREHGFLALSVGISSGAEYILVPEIKTDYKKLYANLNKDRLRGKTSVIIVFAEGVGNPYDLAKNINKAIGAEVRVSALGYIQRGGSPTGRSRVLASQFGAYAVDTLIKGKKNHLVVSKSGIISDIPIMTACKGKKLIDLHLHKLAGQLAT